MRVVLIVLSFFLGLSTLRAQESTVEFWPEIDVWLRLSPRWRVSVFVPLSRNLETNYREGNFAAQVDYVFGSTQKMHFKRMFDENRAKYMRPFMTRGGYLGAKSLGDGGVAYEEKMGYLEMHFRNPLKGDMLVSHRLRTEGRWIGDESQFSYRIRYRLMLEKEYRKDKTSWVPYVSLESYYDSRFEIFNRFRAISGTSVSWSNRFLLEGNVTYQYDSRSSITHLYALNLILHISF